MYAVPVSFLANGKIIVSWYPFCLLYQYSMAYPKVVSSSGSRTSGRLRGSSKR